MNKLSNHQWKLVFLLVGLLFATTACKGEQANLPLVPTDTPQDVSSTPFPLTRQILENLQYHGIYDQAVTLTAGKYAGLPFVEGGVSRPTITLQIFAPGDLDQDGIADAVVVLVENSGGSGSFIYLAAVLNNDGDPVNASTILLGDRVQVQSIEVVDGSIVVTMLTHTPEDPLCCPTHQVEMNYLLNAGQLIPFENE